MSIWVSNAAAAGVRSGPGLETAVGTIVGSAEGEVVGAGEVTGAEAVGSGEDESAGAPGD